MPEQDDYLVPLGELFTEDLNILLANPDLVANMEVFSQLFDQVILRILAGGRVPVPNVVIDESIVALRERLVTIFSRDGSTPHDLMSAKLLEIQKYISIHPDIHEEFQYIPILRD